MIAAVLLFCGICLAEGDSLLLSLKIESPKLQAKSASFTLTLKNRDKESHLVVAEASLWREYEIYMTDEAGRFSDLPIPPRGDPPVVSFKDFTVLRQGESIKSTWNWRNYFSPPKKAGNFTMWIQYSAADANLTPKDREGVFMGIVRSNSVRLEFRPNGFLQVLK